MIFSTVFGPPGARLDGRVVGHQGDRATADVAMPVTTPSAPKPSCSQLASSASSTKLSGVDQPRDALADGQLALLLRLVAVALRPAATRALERLFQVGHRHELTVRPAAGRATSGARSGCGMCTRRPRCRRRSPRAASGASGVPPTSEQAEADADLARR